MGINRYVWVYMRMYGYVWVYKGIYGKGNGRKKFIAMVKIKCNYYLHLCTYLAHFQHNTTRCMKLCPKQCQERLKVIL